MPLEMGPVLRFESRLVAGRKGSYALRVATGLALLVLLGLYHWAFGANVEQGESPTRAKAFLAESASVPDLRFNPLLLSLMCILYRGSGSLPGDRASTYAKCAELLLRKWDEQRDLYQQLRADHLSDHEPLQQFWEARQNKQTGQRPYRKAG